MALSLALAVLSASPLGADPWHSAKSRNSGNYVETYSVTSATDSATELVDSDVAIKSANIDIHNYSGYAIWVGSNTSTLTSTGFPIIASTTYPLDGAYTGSLYTTTDADAGADTNVRVIYYLKNDWNR